MDKIFGFKIKNVLYPVLFVIAVFLVILLIGYIDFLLGKGNVDNIFSDFDKNSYNETVGSVKNTKLSISNNTVELEFTLNNSDEYYEASFPIINTVRKNITLKSINYTGLSVSQEGIFELNVVYDDKVCDKFPCKINKRLDKDDIVNVTISARSKKEVVSNRDKNVSVKIKFNYIIAK